MTASDTRRARLPREAATAPVVELTTARQVAALLHPVRRRVLAALVRPASATEVGRELGISAQVANYHVRALEAAGLARQVETRQKRNLIERRFRALARSFTLSSALALTAEQRHRLQSDAALQQLVHAGDAIRADALRLLESPVGVAPATDLPESAATGHAAAAIELDVELPTEVDRTAFVRAVIDAVRTAAAAFRASRPGGAPSGAEPARFRTHLAIYPIPSESRHGGGAAAKERR